MTCNNYQNQMDAIFDAGALNDFSAEIAEHLKSCAICRSHYDNLLQLENAFSKISEIEIDPGLIAKTTERLQNAGTKSTARPKRLWRPMAAAAIVLFIMFFVVQMQFSTKRQFLDSCENELKFHSAKIQSERANTILFKSENPSEPIIIWVYENEE